MVSYGASQEGQVNIMLVIRSSQNLVSACVQPPCAFLHTHAAETRYQRPYGYASWLHITGIEGH